MGSIRPDGDAPHQTDRILPGSRRPDGTMRKPVRIRAGYVPQEEVAIYQSKGALFRKGTPQAPPGCDFVDDKPKPKSKAAKKNEKRKDKKQQALKEALPDSGSTPELVESQCAKGVDRAEVADYTRVAIQQLAALEVSEVGDTSKVAINKIDLEKKIRAIRKKIRLLDDNKAQGSVIVEPPKEKKLELWQQELNDLEARLAEL